MIGFVMVVITFRYETALLQAADGSELRAMLCICALLCITISALVALICGLAVFGDLLPKDVVPIAWILPAGVLVGGTHQIVSYVQLRFQTFKAMSGSKVAQATSYVGFAAVFSKFGFDRTGLILADTSSKFVAIAAWLSLTSRNHFFRGFQFPTKSEIWQTAYKFRNCPMVTATGGLINAAGGCVTAGLMYVAFGAFDSGQFGLVERSMSLPVGVIGGALSQVYTAKLSKDLRDRSHNVGLYFRRVVAYCFLTAILPSIILFFTAPYLFGVFFGPNWRIAGEFAQIMCPLFLAQFVVCPINMSLLLIGKRSIQVYWELSRLLVLLIGWFALWHAGFTSHAAVSFHVVANVLMSLIFIVLADRLIQRHPIDFEQPSLSLVKNC